MKRFSMVNDVIREIYLDINIKEPTVMIIRDVGVENKIRKTFDSEIWNMYSSIFKELEIYIHSRYTRVIIDGGNHYHIILNYLDKKYNHLIEKDDKIFIENTMMELVEIRQATREDIKEWTDVL